MDLWKVVGATGFEPATPCAQGGFKVLLKLVAGGCRQAIAVESFAAFVWMFVDSCGTLVHS
jgi:hypothetical protein